MAIPDPLAYEIRRLATLIGRGLGADADQPPPPPGELAQRVAGSFGLRSIDVDIALAVLAADLDEEFRYLLYRDAPRSELTVLAALVPRLEERLVLGDAVGRDAPAIQRRLLRRVDGVGQLVATRRFRTAVYGRPLLSDLPEYAQTIDAEPLAVPWAAPPKGLVESMRAATGGVLCVIYGGAGVGKTTWACHAAFSIAGGALRIDAANAANATNAGSELRELIEDAAMVGRPVVLDNARELLRGETRLAVLLDDLLEATPAKIFLVLGDGDTVSERIASRALGIVRIEPPGPLDRRRLWDVAAIPSLQTLADDLVLTPRQIANARPAHGGGRGPGARCVRATAKGTEPHAAGSQHREARSADPSRRGPSRSPRDHRRHPRARDRALGAADRTRARDHGTVRR
jgi:hypothetical protein